MVKLLTLCIIHQGDQVLLGMKKRGFGQGRWNGFGGKVLEGETIEAAAQRELFEEAAITVEDFKKLGVLRFSWQGKEDVLEVHVFKVIDFTGVPTESEEMKPQWFSVHKVPFQEMWQDDQYWFPLFFANTVFKGEFLFDNNDKIVEYKLTP